MKKGKLTAIVPVRAGSQRVKNKNTKPFANSNLLKIKLETLKKVSMIDNIVVNITQVLSVIIVSSSNT